MANTLYYDELFSNRRSELIDRCVELQRQGKNFLYILPSREAMKEVRQDILERNKGIIGSNIIMFDELETMIAESIKENVIEPNCEKVILKAICDDENLDLVYFNKIQNKEGFQKEVIVFIKFLKRNLVTEEALDEIISKIDDRILKKKLVDLSKVYRMYNKFLYENSLYDVNDISIIAIEKAKDSSLLKKYSLIVIDGFLNIDKVNRDLIKVLVENNDLETVINCPFKTAFTNNFLTEEIVNTFKDLSFNINEEVFAKKEDVIEETIELATKLFTASKGEGEFNKLNIVEYPSIKAEVIDTVKKIKRLLMTGVPLSDIAVYVNNKEAYEEDLQQIFQEYKIPINMSFELPLLSYKLSRDLAGTLEALPEEFKVKEGLDFIEVYINIAYETIVKAFEKEDISIVNSLKDLLNALNKTYYSMNIVQEKIEKEAFINIFKDYLNDSKVTITKANRAGVSILNTDLAKGIYFDHIFVLGLNEGEVPVVPKSAGLFNELELKILKDNLIPFKDWNWELDREKIRFILTVASGKKEITLSYRSVNEEGKFAIGSQFIDAVKFIISQKENEKVSIRDYVDFKIDNSMSIVELHKSVLKDKVDCKSNSIFNYLDYEKVKNYRELGDIEEIRKNKPNFTRYEGIVTGDEYFASYKSYFEKLWFKELEDYVQCPMSLMFSKIYGVSKYQSNDDDEDTVNNKEKTIFYKGAINEYYKRASQFAKLEEALIAEVLEVKMDSLLINYQKLSNESKDIIALQDASIKFLTDDIKLRNKFTSKQGTILKPIITDNRYSLDIDSIKVGISIDRVELEYKVVGKEEIPTGRYIIYSYRKKSGIDITRDNIINLDTVEPALLYKATEEILKEKLPKIDLQCLAILYLGIENVKREGVYINNCSDSIFAAKRSKGVSEEKFFILMEHGYIHAKNVIKDIKNGVFNYNLNCNADDKYNGNNCAYKALCRHYKSKGEVMNNV